MLVLRDFKDSLPSLERVYQAAMVNVVPRTDAGNFNMDPSSLRYYVDTNILFIDANCNPLALQRIFTAGATAPVAVIHEAGKVVGVITQKFLDQPDTRVHSRSARELMIPWRDVKLVDIDDSIAEAGRQMAGADFLMVMKNGQPFGTLWAGDLPETCAALNMGTAVIAPEDFIRIIDLLAEGMLVTGPDLRIIYANEAAVSMLGTAKDTILGKNLDSAVGRLFATNRKEYRRRSPVYEVIRHLKPIYNVERKLLSGSTFMLNYLPVVKDGSLNYLVISLRDVSGEKEAIEFNRTAYKEMTEAFRVMLPTTKIEKKLKSIPEYQDIFNPTTGLVEIIEVIPDGTFRHVINCLNIVSELHKKGLFNVSELERTVVVQAMLLHDIGKRQPVLHVGDTVDPQKVFPEGRKHARVSAGLIQNYPLVSPDVIPLIFYHHHREEELPGEFPDRLLPMWRLVRLVDGLSAALTRRHAQLDIWVDGSRIAVMEQNPHPYYNGVRQMDVLSGKGYFRQDIV